MLWAANAPPEPELAPAPAPVPAEAEAEAEAPSVSMARLEAEARESEVAAAPSADVPARGAPLRSKGRKAAAQPPPELSSLIDMPL